MFNRETTFRGTCFRDMKDQWHFYEKEVKTTAYHRRVYFANEEDDGKILGVIIDHTEWGWCISGKNLAGEARETHIPDLSSESVYLVTDPVKQVKRQKVVDKQSAEPAKTAPRRSARVRSYSCK